MPSVKQKKPCQCFSRINSQIEKKGVRLSSSLSQFQVHEPSLDLRMVNVLPLEGVDGKKLKRGQPSTIVMKHCPFCGQEF